MSLEEQYDAWVPRADGRRQVRRQRPAGRRGSEAVQQMQAQLDALADAKNAAAPPGTP